MEMRPPSFLCINMIQAIERLGFEDIYMRGSVTEEFIPHPKSDVDIIAFLDRNPHPNLRTEIQELSGLSIDLVMSWSRVEKRTCKTERYRFSDVPVASAYLDETHCCSLYPQTWNLQGHCGHSTIPVATKMVTP